MENYNVKPVYPIPSKWLVENVNPEPQISHRTGNDRLYTWILHRKPVNSSTLSTSKLEC